MRRVVILGGGYAGIHSYKAIKSMHIDGLEVKVISPQPYHTYHGWTGEILSGRFPVDRTLSALTPIIGNDLICGTATHIHIPSQTLEVKSIQGDKITADYDNLIIATGSTDPLSSIPGAKEFGWALKDTNSMQSLSEHLETAAPKDIAVCGGGISAVEIASALAYRYPNATVRIISQRLPLSDIVDTYPKYVDHALSILENQGIQLIFGSRVVAIELNKLTLANRTKLAADLIVLATGVEFPILPGSEEILRYPNNRIIVNSFMQSTSHPNIWAAGDIAGVKRPDNKTFAPIDALWAMKSGAIAGQNVGRSIEGMSNVPLTFKGLGQAAGLAGNNAVSELYGWQTKGFISKIIRASFFAWFMPDRKMGIRNMIMIIINKRVNKRIP